MAQTIDANNLLRSGMMGACQDTRFDRCRIRTQLADLPDIRSFALKQLCQILSRLILSDNSSDGDFAAYSQ